MIDDKSDPVRDLPEGVHHISTVLAAVWARIMRRRGEAATPSVPKKKTVEEQR